MESNNVPLHVGYIMDGNGRWAKQRHLPRNFGHQKGAEVIYDVVRQSFDSGAKAVSLYAFSTENFLRPKDEVDKIFSLLSSFFKKYRKVLLKEQIKLIVSGDLSVVDKQLVSNIEKCCKDTENFEKGILNIAINYGSRAEIIRAVNKVIESGVKSVTEKDFEKYLYTNTLPDIDLIVRTSGEQRLSNFFTYQGAYAELYFTDVLWPDFDRQEVLKAFEWFAQRKRRFGGLDSNK